MFQDLCCVYGTLRTVHTVGRVSTNTDLRPVLCYVCLVSMNNNNNMFMEIRESKMKHAKIDVVGVVVESIA